VLLGRWLHHLGEVGEIGIVGRHHRREDGRERDQGEDEGSDRRHLVARQSAQHARTGERAGRLLGDRSIEGFDAHDR
jgi:hypothetical protein